MTELELLQLQLTSCFVLDTYNRLLRVNDPSGSPAPRCILAGCAEGNRWLFHAALNDAQRHALASLFEREPPLSRIDSRPVHLEACRAILSTEALQAEPSFGLIWQLPNNTVFKAGDRIVSSHTDAGAALLAQFEHEDMPEPLVKLGFTDTGEFWPPWCAVLCGNEIASLAFTARLGEAAAEIGLVTVPAFRGRGFGAAATAAWAAHPLLANRRLFYGTSPANRASQRVTERLGLRFLGTNCQWG